MDLNNAHLKYYRRFNPEPTTLAGTYLTCVDALSEIVLSDGHHLLEVGKPIRGFQMMERPVTMDTETGKLYGWFWGLYFGVGEKGKRGRVVVAFPWGEKVHPAENRRVAIFQRGPVDKKDMEYILANLTQGFLEETKHLVSCQCFHPELQRH